MALDKKKKKRQRGGYTCAPSPSTHPEIRGEEGIQKPLEKREGVRELRGVARRRGFEDAPVNSIESCRAKKEILRENETKNGGNPIRERLRAWSGNERCREPGGEGV